MRREQVFVALSTDTENKQWSSKIVTAEEEYNLSKNSISSDAKQLGMEALIASCRALKRPSSITLVSNDAEFINLIGFKFKPEKGGSASLAEQYHDVRALCRCRHRIRPVIGESGREYKRWDMEVGFHPGRIEDDS